MLEYKFNVGDEVRVVRDCTNMFAGRTGIIQLKDRNVQESFCWIKFTHVFGAYPARYVDLEHVKNEDIFLKLEKMLSE